MNRLLKIGFEFSGHWILAEDILTLELLRHAGIHVTVQTPNEIRIRVIN